MADLLLSLSAWMLVSLTILPIGIEFLKESSHEDNEFEATVLLYEKLHEMLVEGQVLLPQSIERNGKEYQFTPSEGTKEVCIEFENYHKQKEQVCEFIE